MREHIKKLMKKPPYLFGLKRQNSVINISSLLLHTIAAIGWLIFIPVILSTINLPNTVAIVAYGWCGIMATLVILRGITKYKEEKNKIQLKWEEDDEWP